MKRIEAVIAPWTLDTFKEAALRLGIAEFDVVEVYRSGCATIEDPQRLYRGHQFKADLLPRLKVEFVLFDTDVRATLQRLIELVDPESIGVFKLEHTLRPAKAHLTNSPPLPHTMNHPAERPYTVALRHAADDGNRGQDR
jgi:nitrogen regulatory protein P-II 1